MKDHLRRPAAVFACEGAAGSGRTTPGRGRPGGDGNIERKDAGMIDHPGRRLSAIAATARGTGPAPDARPCGPRRPGPCGTGPCGTGVRGERPPPRAAGLPAMRARAGAAGSGRTPPGRGRPGGDGNIERKDTGMKDHLRRPAAVFAPARGTGPAPAVRGGIADRIAGRVRRILPAPLLLAAAALALPAPGGTAAAEAVAAEAAWETALTVGNKRIILPDDTPGEEWERGYRRQYCMPAYALGTQGALPLEFEPPGFGVEGVPDHMRTQYDNCFGTVADATFRYKGLSIGIEGIYHYTTQTALVIDFRRHVPVEDLAPLRGGRFEIEGRTFTVDDGLEGWHEDDGLANFLIWAVPFWQDDMGWTVGDEITVSFHPPASAVPELSSATVAATGREIALVFDESLDAGAGNGPPAGAFTVTADGAAVTVGGAAVDASAPRRVRLSGLSPAVLPGQAVVVAYADPTEGDDGAAVQDADGNDAPSFATGADGVPAAVNGAVPLLSVADVTVTEGTDAAAVFAVTLAPAATETVTVEYATADGTAMAPGDYAAASGTLSFAPGETSMAVSVTVVDDSVEDSGETFTLALSNPSGAGAALGDGRATATILNDEPGDAPELLHAVADGDTVVLTYGADLDPDSVPPASAFAVIVDGEARALDSDGPVSVSGAAVTLTLASPAGHGETVTVSYAVPAAGALQDASANRVAAFSGHAARNDTPDTAAPELLHAVADGKTVVLTYGEALDEGSVPPARAFTVKADGTWLALAARDPVAVSGDTVTLTLWSRVDRGHAVTVGYAPPRSAPLRDASANAAAALADRAARNDTTDTRAGPGGPVTQVGDPAWSTTLTVGSRVHLNSDRTAGGELVRGYDRQECMARWAVGSLPQPYPGLGAGDPEDRRSGYDNCFGTIGDDTLEHGDLTLRIESVFHFVVERVVMIRLRDSVPRERLEGLRGGWFVLKDRKFPVDRALGRAGAGEIDRLDWGADFWRSDMGWTVGETVPVSFHPAGSAIPALSVGNVRVTEGRDATADFTVRLSPAATGTVTVDYATADGSARAPGDYTATSGTLTFAPGETAKTVSVPIVDDSVEDSGERFTLRLSNASGGAAILEYGEATATIANHELTAEFSGAPAGHGGEPFTVELAFNDAPEMSYRVLQPVNGREGRLNVVNATALRVRRIEPGGNRRWLLSFDPSGTGDVTVTLPATADCEAAGAVCTADGRPLSAAATVTVPHGPPGEAGAPFAARIEALPEAHDGEGEVSFELRFSEEPVSYGYRTLRDETLEIRQGGTRLAPRVRRMARPSSRAWTVTVAPVSKADITVAVVATDGCGDPGAVCNADGEPLSAGVEAVVPGPPGLSVADAAATEAAGATLDFRVTLGRASSSAVTVDYRTFDGTATAGADYAAASGTLEFAPGETERTVSVAVLDDAHDEGAETMTLALSNPSGGNAWIADAHGTGTISNADPVPGAWLARFGRATAEQAADAVRGRLSADRTPGFRGRIAGQALPDGTGAADPAVTGGAATGAGPLAVPGLAEGGRRAFMALLAPAAGEGPGDARGLGRGDLPAGRGIAAGDALAGTSFDLVQEADGLSLGLWGRAARSGFSGRAGGPGGALALEGETASVTLGVDGRRNGALLGLMLFASRGEGTYRGPGGDPLRSGAVEADLSGLVPYAGRVTGAGLSVWGAAGTAEGETRLTPGGREAPFVAGLRWSMAAAGIEGAPAAGLPGGATLGWHADALWTRTESEAAGTPGAGRLAATAAETTRVRLGLEAAWERTLASGVTLHPRLGIAARLDGGDAETGFGLEAAGGVRIEDPGRGLSVTLDARTLALHGDGGFEDGGLAVSVAWDPRPETRLGPSVIATRGRAAASPGGLDALPGPGTLPVPLAGDGDGPGLEMAWGTDLSAWRLGAVGTAYGRVTGRPDVRDLRLGWRVGPDAGRDIGRGHDFWLDPGAGGGEAGIGAGLGWTRERTGMRSSAGVGLAAREAGAAEAAIRLKWEW